MEAGGGTGRHEMLSRALQHLMKKARDCGATCGQHIVLITDGDLRHNEEHILSRDERTLGGAPL